MLGSFHYWNMKNRMTETVYHLAMMINSDTLDEEMQRIAEEEQACIVLYRIENGTAEVMHDYDEVPSCIIHSLDSGVINSICEIAAEDGGLLQVRMSDLVEEMGNDKKMQSLPDRLLTALVVFSGDERYLLFLDSGLFPVESTVSTLRFQLGYISAGLLIISTIVSFLLAHYIARPIERITGKSKQLSKGRYDVDANERSYREIEELSETLGQAAEEISKVDRLQKELIANISHDLRTPLTMIIGYGEVMRDIEEENTPENMQVIIDEATRLSVMVNDLLEISRIQGGVAERNNEVFDLSAEVSQTIERYRHLKENGGFSFLADIQKDLIVKADKMKILQVLCNLLNNAVNYSDADKRIEVFLRGKNGTVRLEVKDHGVGIAPEDIENIWQRYYKVDRVHRRSTMGSGLGLSIVREILDLHGARYGVQSKIGEGSVFWFELPLYSEEENALLLDE